MLSTAIILRRCRSGLVSLSVTKQCVQVRAQSTAQSKQISEGMPPSHRLLPTSMLLRSLLITTISSHRILLNPALAILSFLSRPQRAIFDLEKNKLLRSLLKNTLYKHFCAGENHGEVAATIQGIKNLGFKGVILTYAKEVVVDSTHQEVGVGVQQIQELENPVPSITILKDQQIEAWREGVLHTVGMIGEGDFLALKFTGAGAAVADALATHKPLPAQMLHALDDICQRAIDRGASILIDAEQQFVQPGIDKVAIDLMGKFNYGDRPIVYNTYQAYLKSTPKLLLTHLRQASADGFSIGVKLVRGAYMSSEPRKLINDTKEQTDDTYNMIASGILQKQYYDLGSAKGFTFPKAALFLATHNKTSTMKTYELQQARSSSGLPLTSVQYGQLLGMADDVSCTLLQLAQKDNPGNALAAPEAYKCLSWGSLTDCISYLQRRATENRDAVSRTRNEYILLKREAWWRFKRFFW